MKINKVLLAIFAIAIMTTSVFMLEADNGSAGAYNVFGQVSGDFTFDLDTGSKEAKLTAYNSNADTVVIPNTVTYSGDTYSVTVIGAGAFHQKTHLTNLTMGSNVITIEEKAFRETGIKSLDLRNVRYVGSQAFMHCTQLTTLTANELIEVGPYAFAILDYFNGSPYTGSIPRINSLSLPKAEKIGEGAFGARVGQSLARDFGTVSLPSVKNVGDYAFAKSKIDVSLSMPLVETIGTDAFFLSGTAEADTAAPYALSLQRVTSIGSSAFTGRAIRAVDLSSSPYTIGNYAFEFTLLTEANLGMVSNIGIGAFDKIDTLRFFTVAPANTNYASLISDNQYNKGERGALYQLSASGDPITLMRLPPKISDYLTDYSNKFTVANGVTSMEGSAFYGCPSITVDLNGITEIPFSSFADTNVVGVIAKNVTKIGTGAFNSCSALVSFEFLDAGGALLIEQNAFSRTRISNIYLPARTTLNTGAFSAMSSSVGTLGIWADVAAAGDAFSGTVVHALQVTSDSSTAAQAKALYDGWNASGWTYKGSDRISLLIIDNLDFVDISGLKPGSGSIQVTRTIGPSTYGLSDGTNTLQFTEYKDKKTPPFHMESVKAGIYTAESHGTSGSPITMYSDVNGAVPAGKTCYSGDGVTWELVYEYYLIHFYSLRTDGDHDSDGVIDGEDEDYIIPPALLSSLNVSDRTFIEDRTYLAGNELKDLLWQDFVRYSLEGWFAADDPLHASATLLDKAKRVTAGSQFGTSSGIPEAWIYRDPVTDQGILNLYGAFVGKEYMVQLEARRTGGQTNQSAFNSNPNAVGGKVELWISGSLDMGTGSAGSSEKSYPYGTDLELRAVPNVGYTFVGWAVIDVDDQNDVKLIFDVKNDRSYVQSHGTAVWALELPHRLKFVAYFAQTDTVNFDYNDGTAAASRTYVVGDRLVEANNDYNGRDYEALLNKTAEVYNLTNGTTYYPGTPTSINLDFDGWYYNTTSYARWNGTDLTNLTPMPSSPSTLPLRAKWFATITFYPDDGINDANLAGMGLTETSAGSGVYTYRHDVGSYVGGANVYSNPFNYGAGSPPAYVPTIADVLFNGWYVLTPGHAAVPTIADVDTGTGTNPYSTKKRFVSGSAISGHIDLMALYAADVEFYFNNATAVDASVSAPVPFKVAAPASEVTAFGSAAYFGTVETAMQNAETTGNTYKEDANGVRMPFMGWYVTADGATLPTAADTLYTPATVISKSVKLIAGWGVNVTFADGGVPGIIDISTSTQWVPGSYGFTVLEGTAFSLTGSGMPDIRLSGVSPSTWYDADTTPYTWYSSTTLYTYSVTLTPEFRDLFVFNMMGGTPGTVFVPYSSADTFADVLNEFNASMYSTSLARYLDIAKGGLYYANDGAARTAADPHNAIWYKAPTVYGGTFTQWDPTDAIGTDTYAYIRWQADVDFDLNIPAADRDPSSGPQPSMIAGVDEGTPFSDLAPLSVPMYNAAMDKTFKGWFDGAIRYTDGSGAAVSSVPDITGSIKLNAVWGVEVRFYYTGSITSAIPPGAPQGTDATGTFVVFDVDGSGHVTPPSLSKAGFTDNHLMWYEEAGGVNGFDRTVPLSIANFLPASAPGSFDPSQLISENKTVYSRWYAEVDFNLSNPSSGSFFATVTKNLLEGSKLSDLTGINLDPISGDPMRANWIFVGWFDQSAAPADYEDLGLQYYRTDLDYTNGGTLTDPNGASQTVTGNLTLSHEYVVQVDFDPGYVPAAAIPTKYLRVEQPLPDSGPRFTDKPARTGVTFMGWVNLSDGKKYTENVPDSALPNAEPVMDKMTLTAVWLVTVRFFDLQQYLADGMLLAVDGVKVVYVDVTSDGYTNDDYFEMPEGATIRQFISADPAASGKTFVSWFVEQGLADGLFASGDILYGLGDRIVSDITLTAGYGFTMSFDTRGGTPSAIPDKLVIEGQSFDLPEAPAKGRLTFSGWDDTATIRGAGAAVTPAGDTTFYAKWKVTVKIFDGLSMTPLLTMEWDEDAGPAVAYSTTTDPAYDNRVVSATITYAGTPVTVEKFLDKCDFSSMGWVSYYSVLDGWYDPFTGATFSPTAATLFTGLTDSAALFALWKERARFYNESNSLVSTDYIDSGAYLGTAAPPGYWSDAFNPTMPLNLGTFRIRDSMDLVAIKFITVTFDAAGGTPATQTFSNVVSGSMLGVIPAAEPVRSGMYFSGWYVGNTKYAFTDKLYSDTTLTAKWQSTPVDRYTIFATAYENATISPQGMIRVMAGDTVSFDYYAAKGYSPVLKIDGGIVPGSPAGTYTFRNVRSDHSIEVLADDQQKRDATAYLTVNISGKGDVLYSEDAGATFKSYTSPLPLFSGADYVLKAVPKGSSYFDHWSGDASGKDPQVEIVSDGTKDMSVTAHFGSSSGFGMGELAIANLILMILTVIIGIVALTVAYKRNYEGTGVGKALRLGAMLVALISVVLFFLTEGFSGSYVPYDGWTIVMAILTLVALIMALVSVRYDYQKE